MKLYSEHRVNPFASCLPLILQLPVFISLYTAIKGVGPLSAAVYQPSVQALSHASFLWIPELGKPDPYYILLILYVVTQMISTELMVGDAERQQPEVDHARDADHVRVHSSSASRPACSCTGSRRTSGRSASS